MKSIDIRALILAFLVIAMFSLVGIAIAYQNFFLVILFFLLGCFIMMYGIRTRKKSDS